MTAETKPPVNKHFNYVFILFMVLVPAIVYLYFLQWKTGTIYGDDLYIFKKYEGLNRLSEKISMPVSFGKYRPVHGLSMHFLIEVFQKNIGSYYIFNIAIQVINTFLFALTINLFLRAPSLSLLFGLTIGLSRFSYFNVTQLLNGGALEGLAMAFFLAALYFLVKALISDDCSGAKKQKAVIRGILFANLSMYTHERYIVLFLFIIPLIFIYPGLKQFTRKKKISTAAIALGSIVLNVVLKKAVYNLPFFMGTASTGIKFSLSTATGFFTESVLSIFQVNVGPQHLVGIEFTSLPFPDKLLVIVLLAGFLATLIIYLRKVKKAFILKQREQLSHFWLFLSLAVLFGLFLVPAVATIRLEQRWLQASYAVFLLMFAIAFSNIHFRSKYIRNWILALFLMLLLWTDFTYLKEGVNNIYITNAEQMGSEFEQAIHKGIILPDTKTIYIWEKQKDSNTENSINWDLAEGYFFDFYQGHEKAISFPDTVYQRKYPFNSFRNFSSSADQILYLDNNITDLTSEYLRDSLRGFSSRINGLTPGGNNHYNQNQLLITAADFDKFSVAGFYEQENGIRWTNGNAVIGFSGDYIIKDSVTVTLATYMPPVCKNITPKIILRAISAREYLPFVSLREGNKFTFKFYFQELTAIREVNILSATIPPTPPDRRVLSFPFISLSMKKPEGNKR